ncbi:DUF4097 domain-containing protein [Sulfidibacter corallicola]|uniref:DUF4097 family beta strand repeat protein n=1 Tax=Sulfidibacter corallicola TaxID=2818388 RepID=A0A8A4TVU3_SULCO|nr:DUF4097 family beta strand repeat-containing protein [Sulfidibacter corallicola]QTD53603.1 DUF4097 family beta strand repeat protein [Sulfidibacter corallicola]
MIVHAGFARTILCAASVLLLSHLPVSAAGDINIDRTFQVGASPVLNLDTHKGELKIRPVEGDEIVVKARIRAEEGTEELDLVDVRFRQVGDRVYVDVDYQETRFWNNWNNGHRILPAVDFDITVPQRTELRVDSHKSDIDIVAPDGRLTLEAHKGRGQIRGVHSDLRFETHKGDFDIEVTELADLDISTHKGYVKVQVLSGDNFRIRGNTHKGDLAIVGRDVRHIVQRNGYSINHREGTGDAMVQLETHKGFIELAWK